ncbi:hypothetical protein TNCV_2720351 [Trichonephila clavipes]|nr:hypothetical protein TNCV_2720351 [Trichonephila clavipes]
MQFLCDVSRHVTFGHDTRVKATGPDQKFCQEEITLGMGRDSLDHLQSSFNALYWHAVKWTKFQCLCFQVSQMPFMRMTMPFHILRDFSNNVFKDLAYIRGLPSHQTFHQ